MRAIISFRHTSFVLLLLASAACAGSKPPHGPTGASDLQVLPPPPRQPLPEGYKPRLGPPEIPPEVQEQALPGYPESALPDEVACVARLLYHILRDGSVKLVRLEWDEPPPAGHRGSFEESIRKAILGWRFIPAIKWVPTRMEDGSTKTVPQAIPKAERAIVRFSVEEGRGVVE